MDDNEEESVITDVLERLITQVSADVGSIEDEAPKELLKRRSTRERNTVEKFAPAKSTKVVVRKKALKIEFEMDPPPPGLKSILRPTIESTKQPSGEVVGERQRVVSGRSVASGIVRKYGKQRKVRIHRQLQFKIISPLAGFKQGKVRMPVDDPEEEEEEEPIKVKKRRKSVGSKNKNGESINGSMETEASSSVGEVSPQNDHSPSPDIFYNGTIEVNSSDSVLTSDEEEERSSKNETIVEKKEEKDPTAQSGGGGDEVTVDQAALARRRRSHRFVTKNNFPSVAAVDMIGGKTQQNEKHVNLTVEQRKMRRRTQFLDPSISPLVSVQSSVVAPEGKASGDLPRRPGRRSCAPKYTPTLILDPPISPLVSVQPPVVAPEGKASGPRRPGRRSCAVKNPPTLNLDEDEVEKESEVRKKNVRGRMGFIDGWLHQEKNETRPCPLIVTSPLRQITGMQFANVLPVVECPRGSGEASDESFSFTLTKKNEDGSEDLISEVSRSKTRRSTRLAKVAVKVDREKAKEEEEEDKSVDKKQRRKSVRRRTMGGKNGVNEMEVKGKEEEEKKDEDVRLKGGKESRELVEQSLEEKKESVKEHPFFANRRFKKQETFEEEKKTEKCEKACINGGKNEEDAINNKTIPEMAEIVKKRKTDDEVEEGPVEVVVIDEEKEVATETSSIITHRIEPDFAPFSNLVHIQRALSSLSVDAQLPLTRKEDNYTHIKFTDYSIPEQLRQTEEEETKEEEDISIFGETMETDMQKASVSSSCLPWCDVLRPKTVNEWAGDTENSTKVVKWMRKWRKRIKAEQEEPVKKATKPKRKRRGSSDYDDSDPDYCDGDDDGEESRMSNPLILTGPTGIGKSALIYAASCDENFSILECTPCELRSQVALRSKLSGALASHRMPSRSVGTLFSHFSKGPPSAQSEETECDGKQKNTIVVVEHANVVFDGHDTNFWTTIVALIETARVPVVLTMDCNVPSEFYNALNNCPDGIEPFHIHLTPSSPSMAAEKIESALTNADVYGVKREGLECMIRRNRGDLRATINDLQLTSTTRKDWNESRRLHGREGRNVDIHNVWADYDDMKRRRLERMSHELFNGGMMFARGKLSVEEYTRLWRESSQATKEKDPLVDCVSCEERIIDASHSLWQSTSRNRTNRDLALDVLPILEKIDQLEIKKKSESRRYQHVFDVVPRGGNLPLDPLEKLKSACAAVRLPL